MADDILLQKCLDLLNIEVKHSKEKRTAIETLLTIYRNLLKDGNSEKYRKLKISNPMFFDKVWKFKGCQQFMITTGWKECGTDLLFNDGICLPVVISLLLENRLLAPVADEWVQESKYEGKSREQIREEDLRKKAIAERNKEIAEYLKDKKYREELAKQVKSEHVADMLKRRYDKAQISNQLPGATK